MRSYHWGVLLVSFFGFSVHAADLAIPSGRYVKVGPSYGAPGLFGITGEEDRLIVQKRGSQIAILHATQRFSLQYRFDLNNSGEQDFPKNYLEVRRNDNGAKALANIIEKVSISDVVQGSSPNEIKANANIYIHIPSIFGASIPGDLRAKVQIAGKFEVRTCPVEISIVSPGGQQYQTTSDPAGTCIQVEWGTDSRVVSINSGLGELADKIVALTLNILLRVESRLGGEVMVGKVPSGT